MDKVLKSKIDASVNFIEPQSDGGFFECRYVRRDNNYIIVYLSSQSGCRQGCRMCHLTATKQTTDRNATPEDFLRQAKTVLDWYSEKDSPVNVVNFDFMVRGDFFANSQAVNDCQRIFQLLDYEAFSRGLVSRFLVSTIMPKNIENVDLRKILRPIQPEIYYSVYSMDSKFRKKWLPNAMYPYLAFQKLSEYQHVSRKILKLHWAFIAGENDSEQSVKDICKAVNDFGLRVDVNIVRYNPYSSKFGVEPDEGTLKERIDLIQTLLPHSKVEMVSRIGIDVKAACGMFVTSTD